MNGTHAIIEINGALSHAGAIELLALMEKAALSAGATIIGRNVHEFGEGFGHTGVLLLAESHISVHTWPENDYAAFDIFMCGDAAIHRAVDVLVQDKRSESHFVKIFHRGRDARQTYDARDLANIILSADISLISRICNELECNAAIARSAFIELLKFLLLASTHTELVPSIKLAKIWQQLVINTELYEKICQQYFSRFIHFKPEYLHPSSTLDLSRTLALYRERWGEPMRELWSGESERRSFAAKNTSSFIQPLS